MPTHALIIGRGLLGSALARSLRALHHTVIDAYLALPWTDADALALAFDRLLSDLEARTTQESWVIAWAAGHSVMHSSSETVDHDVRSWKMFLEALSKRTSLLQSNGTIVVASSAGALYQSDGVCTERTPPSPPSPYGQGKLVQEMLMKEWSDAHPEIRVLIARIATLYGPQQNSTKAQGLISHMSRCIIQRRPIHIFVPLDTIRDYLFVDDAAASIADCMQRLATSENHCITKIIASEQITTVAQIIGHFRRIASQPPRIVSSISQRQFLYQRSLQLRSIVWPDMKSCRRGLLEGMASIHQHQKNLYARGMLDL